MNKKAMFASISAGITCGYANLPILNEISSYIISLFISYLKLISLPIVFASITSALSGDNYNNVKQLLTRVLKYTLITTAISCLVALIVFTIFFHSKMNTKILTSSINFSPIIQYFIDVFPKDIFSPFVNHNPLSIAILALIIGMSSTKLSNTHKRAIHEFCNLFMQMLFECTKIINNISPIMFWAFSLSAVKEIQLSSASSDIITCVLCIVIANLIQAFICLPIFLKIKGICPITLAKKSMPVLTFAFFSKSSSATLPLAIDTCEKELDISSRISKSVLPMCTIINMNACAAFILISSMFVTIMNGFEMSISNIFTIFVVSIISAIGNSGSPMGCYFMSCAYLESVNQNISIMSAILPYYLLIDMLETATNVWSDLSVCSVVNRENAKD
ncbi:dicarboxylate/amino acid:cation symporter [Candidatus Gromoviella agglomerans]|uniref:dicarboxylate/amino acid:cation symporter n=1 Tax=Candidatus Gromoviella agglomerans TaxID=2806609 RepID=UPI001E443490|nr:cation:dicarboxylase symporter family transporter [Candidatus Gromoviella agglomerans]UFX98483.1 Dicarboxylate symporter family protein [Candidatus Gromoviella agglomerans]